MTKKNASKLADTLDKEAIKNKTKIAIKPIKITLKPKLSLSTKNTTNETHSEKIDSSKDLFESKVRLASKNISQDTNLVKKESATKVLTDVEIKAKKIAAETPAILAEANFTVPKWPSYDEPSLEKTKIEKELKEVSTDVIKWKILCNQI